MWHIEINEDCIGSGVCAGTAPGYFTLAPDGYARPSAETVEPDETVLDAAASCPMEAIVVTDQATGAAVDF